MITPMDAMGQEFDGAQGDGSHLLHVCTPSAGDTPGRGRVTWRVRHALTHGPGREPADRVDKQTAFLALFTWNSFFRAWWPRKDGTSEMVAQVS